jgi:hypothetical protein
VEPLNNYENCGSLLMLKLEQLISSGVGMIFGQIWYATLFPSFPFPQREYDLLTKSEVDREVFATKINIRGLVELECQG